MSTADASRDERLAILKHVIEEGADVLLDMARMMRALAARVDDDEVRDDD